MGKRNRTFQECLTCYKLYCLPKQVKRKNAEVMSIEQFTAVQILQRLKHHILPLIHTQEGEAIYISINIFKYSGYSDYLNLYECF